VLVFTPDFFAAQRPNTALDMVDRVPGFTIDDGAGTRGFEGAVGNILINNNRPASKNDTGTDVLERTPAGQVDRIELIRGGAPGIDMQGYSVVVNVILKTAASRQSIVTWNNQLFDGGHDVWGGSYQFTAKNGERSWSVLLSDGTSTSDSNGVGRNIRRDGAGKLMRDEAFVNDGWGGGARSGATIRARWPAARSRPRPSTASTTGRSGRRSARPAFRRSDYAEDTKSGELGLTYIRPLAPKWTLEDPGHPPVREFRRRLDRQRQTEAASRTRSAVHGRGRLVGIDLPRPGPPRAQRQGPDHRGRRRGGLQHARHPAGL
jgi:hypothetical protein